MDQRLRYIFTTVNEWLRFLETKHTALIALNGAAIIGLIQALPDVGNSSLKQLIPYWLIPGLLTALLISLFSMTQWATKVVGFQQQKRLTAANALYFGYISALDNPAFEAELVRLKCTSDPVTEVEQSLIAQIHINSKIAFAKQRLFHWAISLTFLTIGFCFIVFWVTRFFCAS